MLALCWHNMLAYYALNYTGTFDRGLFLSLFTCVSLIVSMIIYFGLKVNIEISNLTPLWETNLLSQQVIHCMHIVYWVSLYFSLSHHLNAV